MKIGDLVRWESVMNDDMDVYEQHYGIVMQISRTGHKTRSAKILFNDGEVCWFDTQRLEVVSEAR